MELDSGSPGPVGRGQVWGELTALLDRDRPEPAGVLLVGAAGIGKTTLVERFVARARQLGFPVARATGEAGAEPYAVLRALFAGADPGALPAGQQRALRAALTDDGTPVDLLALRAAVCAMCALLAGELPLVLVVDDVDRSDPPTLDLLLTVASVLTWRQVPVIAVFASRTERVPVELADLLRQIPVPPLAERDAEILLDRVGAPTGSARLEILRRAAGNPLALLEYGAWTLAPRERDAGNLTPRERDPENLTPREHDPENLTPRERDAENLTPREGGAGNLVAREGGAWTSDDPGSVAQVFARRIRALPEVSRRALTLAAAGERNVAVLARADPALTPAAWPPAEEAGLVTVADAVVRFRHPLVEFAVLDQAGAGARRRAHRLLAEATADPRRALWHRAEAAGGIDPELAGELIAAARTLDGAAAVTAIGLLEQAGELLPPGDRAPVLLEASVHAAAVGRIRWASDIATRARAILNPDPADLDPDPAQAHADLDLNPTQAGLDLDLDLDLDPTVAPADPADPAPAPADPAPARADSALARAGLGSDSAADLALRAQLDAFASWILTMRGRVDDAAVVLTASIAAGATGFLETAALPAFLLGDGPLSDALRAARPATLFPRAAVMPDEDVRTAILAVPEPATPDEFGPAAVAGAGAMLIDEPEHALRLLGPATRAVVGGTAAGAYLTAPLAACWALIDTGRWVEAEQSLVPLLASPVMAEATMVRSGAAAQLAVIESGRGLTEEPADLIGSGRGLSGESVGLIGSGRGHSGESVGLIGSGRGLSGGFAGPSRGPGVEPAEPALALRWRWARGVGALAVGEHAEAYRLLHAAAEIAHPWRVLVLPDLITAAGHAGRAAEGREIYGRVLRTYRKSWLSDRKRGRLAAAGALLIAEPGRSAEELAAVVEAAGAQRWPFERAVLAVELADRLRRAQQPARAKDVLVRALDTFERLRAAAWTGRVHADLRIAVPATASTLTAQQDQIVRLAAQGLSNREIGERLFLSPRTVGSHLYRLFPQLGVTNRTQLGEVVDRLSPAKDAQ
ncbi:LuxR family transcriptional regulator [Actinoplanes sp. L3-i22]|uniref:helix-turn-helix transcriptional regulator n=1 Tax=Actinoplanes sp. L3-i22 TaxID=2836373 RepID=UPI001C7950E3|nr:AAA family ATPase [Actinoplanes sp. L3-i22]BCY14174.1 hypothetical protein L3i22_092620 [Actinoplanes sp. L3-i22]